VKTQPPYLEGKGQIHLIKNDIVPKGRGRRRVKEKTFPDTANEKIVPAIFKKKAMTGTGL